MSKKEKIFRGLTIVSAMLFLLMAVLALGTPNIFDKECKPYLERAASASTVEIAKAELEKVIEFAENNNLTESNSKNLKNDVVFWYNNIKAVYEQLNNLPEGASILEKNSVLMNVRECLTQSISTKILIYDNNLTFYTIGTIIFGILCIICILVYAIESQKQHNKIKKELEEQFRKSAENL